MARHVPMDDGSTERVSVFDPRFLAVYPVIDLTQLACLTVAAGEGLIGAALRGGATMIQLREKGERNSDVVRLCQAIRPWLDEAQVPLIINDRVDLALDAGAAGVHLGQHDGSVSEARVVARARGAADIWIGLSVTTVEQARVGLSAGATYLSASPVFATATKPDIDPAVGLDGIRQLRQSFVDTPLVAIGGIKPANVPAVIGAGADGVAFISAMGTQPEYAVRAMADAVHQTRAEKPLHSSFRVPKEVSS